MRPCEPDAPIPSWAIGFAPSQERVLLALSGMNTLIPCKRPARGLARSTRSFPREGNNYAGGSIVNLGGGNTEVAQQELRQNARPKLSGHVDKRGTTA